MLKNVQLKHNPRFEGAYCAHWKLVIHIVDIPTLSLHNTRSQSFIFVKLFYNIMLSHHVVKTYYYLLWKPHFMFHGDNAGLITGKLMFSKQFLNTHITAWLTAVFATIVSADINFISPNYLLSQSKSKVKSQKDLEWLYSALPPTNHHPKTITKTYWIKLKSDTLIKIKN